MGRAIEDLIAETEPRELIATQTVLYDEAGNPVGEGISNDTIGFETLTVSTAVVGLTPTVGATAAEVTVELADVRTRLDGTDPAASVGHLVFDGGVITLNSAADLASFRAIRDGAVNASLSISYLG